MRRACAIILTESERESLTRWSRGRNTPARLVLRAKIVLSAATGPRNKEMAHALQTSQETIGRWRRRFVEKRLPGNRGGNRWEIAGDTTSVNSRLARSLELAGWLAT